MWWQVSGGGGRWVDVSEPATFSSFITAVTVLAFRRRSVTMTISNTMSVLFRVILIRLTEWEVASGGRWW
ncbi:hypothetical protein HanOQP8_Chr09g0307551 [Helianthus annuus]|nr:hypothetical protein HanIR_Chr09g0394841 [Helianthus annuus]KAJ0705908.1 hypothetical protein HanLR1_Chr09g0300791 [Helianthus annuus]KAJ0710037.1 hypothetical protein HanOQP8_Chr09g0307551 [Helianthus annuus]KAJ0891388.1 hypothetical protein HanPSC8_Chr09g0353141 [Helianthus annuus]